MKTKKVVKKLDKVESLLSSIIDQYDTDRDPRLRKALTSAKDAVRHAQETVDHRPESKATKKPQAKAAAAQEPAAERGRRAVRVAAGGE